MASKRRSGRLRKRIADLSPREQLSRSYALESLSLMRTRGLSLTKAASTVSTSPRTIRKYVGSALWKAANGRYRAKPTDRLLRSLRFLTPEGQVTVNVHSSKTASRIGEYANAVRQALSRRAPEILRPFRNEFITSGEQRYPFITDLHLLEFLESAGEGVSFEDIYSRMG